MDHQAVGEGGRESFPNLDSIWRNIYFQEQWEPNLAPGYEEEEKR